MLASLPLSNFPRQWLTVFKMNTEPFRWIVAILLGLVVSSWIRTYIRLRHIPGPPGVGFSKLWLLKKSFGGRFHLDTLELCEKYGI
jgi:hypothetical protein